MAAPLKSQGTKFHPQTKDQCYDPTNDLLCDRSFSCINLFFSRRGSKRFTQFRAALLRSKQLSLPGSCCSIYGLSDSLGSCLLAAYVLIRLSNSLGSCLLHTDLLARIRVSPSLLDSCLFDAYLPVAFLLVGIRDSLSERCCNRMLVGIAKDLQEAMTLMSWLLFLSPMVALLLPRQSGHSAFFILN